MRGSSLSRNRSAVAYWGLMAVAAVVVFLFNVFTTLKPDDILYSLIPGHEQERCSTLMDYIRSAPFFYQDTNGRLGDIIERFLTSLAGKPVFNVLNTIVTVLFLHLMVKLGTGRRSLLMLALSIVFVLLLMPMPGETMLWMAGSCNYLWGVTASLAILLTLTRLDANSRHNALTHVAVGIAALLAGWMNESITAGTLLGIAVYYVFNWRRFKGLAITIVVCYAIGVAIDFASPALWERMGNDNALRSDITVTQMLVRRTLNTLTKSAHFITPALAFLLMAVLVVRGRWHRVTGNMLALALLGVTLMIVALAITTSYRSYTAFAVYSFVLVAGLVVRWLEDRCSAVVRRVAVVALLAVAVIPAWKGLGAVKRYKAFDDNVITAIAAAPRQCVLKEAVWPEASRFVFPVNYTNERPWPHKRYYCYYFDKDMIEFLAPATYKRWKSGTFDTGFGPAPFITEPALPTPVLANPDADYALMPIDSLDVLTSTQKCYVTYADMAAHLGAEETARRQLMGEFPSRMPLTCYLMPYGGHTYLVLPELTDEVMQVDMKLIVDGSKLDVAVKRVAPQQ